MQTKQNNVNTLFNTIKTSVQQCKNFNLFGLLLWMSFIFCIIPPLFCFIYDYAIFHLFNAKAFFIFWLTYIPWQFPLMLERPQNKDAILPTFITLITYMTGIILSFWIV